MKETIKLYFSNFLPLENSDLEMFAGKFTSKHFKKGEYFIKEGNLSSEIGFILKGCLVCVYNKEGVEFIDEFCMENEFISDYPSLLDNKPAEKDVKCLEDTELLVVKASDLNDLYNQKHSFERVGRIIAESLFKNWHQKAVSLMLDDAETRYKKLIKNRPTLPQRVPQYLIASYLNVTPESLSRIRKKISQ
ncbi:MAG: Crp/Fnr family transcriptional regulator [Sporocytophaga sp.]|uniref:Crp/Fnr family transcriptional regulator n=1 Tax=Sporocytophaga sp. TaxID=2231183 RepID=UPI001B1C766A|nr:Crp/Fnr family transcriptional regulator [Sporocytophaga sp.]MBO9698631.1 Crp/Fnr family transcriptional regulator [Sporocytophaga sp.]